VLYLWLIILSVGGDVLVESFLVTDFMNFNIKSVQSFKDAHRLDVRTCVYINECLYVYKYLCLCCVFKKVYI
jgi:hypothetical protein